MTLFEQMTDIQQGHPFKDSSAAGLQGLTVVNTRLQGVEAGVGRSCSPMTQSR